MFKLDRRLNAVKSELVGDTIADIGTDHGRLVVSALADNTVKHAYAVDISAKSLEKAGLLARYYGLEDRVTLLTGDGLLPLKCEVDTVVIAGLGGIAISEILNKKYLDARYVLVPHQDGVVLRRYLKENWFFIEKDYFVKSGKTIYEIIVTHRGESNYSESEVILGKNYPKTEEFSEFLLYRERKLNAILRSIENNGSEEINPDIKTELKEIELWKTTSLRN